MCPNFFPETPKFQIDYQNDANAVQMKVTFNVSTINRDYEKCAAQYANKSRNGVRFDIEGPQKLTISVRMGDKFDERIDHQFRTAIGVASRHHIFSSEVDTVLKKYENFFAEHGLKPAPKMKA